MHGLKGGYSTFLTVLATLQLQLTAWLGAVHQTPESFTNMSLPFLDIYRSGYPSLTAAESPDTVLDLRAFSPMLEMSHSFIWHLTSDATLTTASKKAQKVFSTFVEWGEMAITEASYFGAVIPGRLCANFAYYFAVVAGWHTRINPL
jgi:hypothetical protein